MGENPWRLAETKQFKLLRDRGLLLLILSAFLSAFSNSLAMTFNGIYARSLDGGNFLVGLMIAVSAFAELPAIFYNEHFARVLHAPNTIIFANLLMAFGFVGYIYTPTPNLIPLFSIIKGIGYGLWITLTICIVTRRTPDQWGTTAQSLVTVSTFGLVPLVANPIGWWMNDMISTRAVFWLGVATLLFASALLMVAIRWKDFK